MKIMKVQLFLLVIFLTIVTGLVPHHRKVRQIRPEDVKTISEEEMKMLSPERLALLNKKYTEEFFKPLDRRVPMSVKFFLDKKSFLRELPYQYFVQNQLLPNFTDLDFDQRVRQKKDMYFPLYMHESESAKDEEIFNCQFAKNDNHFGKCVHCTKKLPVSIIQGRH